MKASISVYRAMRRENARMKAPKTAKATEKIYRLCSLISEQEGERDADSHELGQREINKDDPPLQNVDAEIGMDEDEQDTGRKGPY